MQLEEYRVRNGLTYRQLAEKLKLSKSTAYNVCKGGSSLSLQSAQKIVSASNNKVTYDDLFPGGRQ